jgi:hypothetical protein
MPHAYTESQLVEQPAIELLELGWQMGLAHENLCRMRDLLLPGQVNLVCR